MDRIMRSKKKFLDAVTRSTRGFKTEKNLATLQKFLVDFYNEISSRNFFRFFCNEISSGNFFQIFFNEISSENFFRIFFNKISSGNFFRIFCNEISSLRNGSGRLVKALGLVGVEKQLFLFGKSQIFLGIKN